MSNTWVYVMAAVAFGGSWLVKQWLKKTYATWSQVPNTYQITGAQAAAAILAKKGIKNVKIERVKGKLTDHFDPAKDILRLSQSNHDSISVAAMAVSAHEAGHAIQDYRDDVRLRLRKYMVPIAAFGGRFSPYLLMGGFMTGSSLFLRLGAFLMVGTLIFQLLTLPVEFNASRRALANLEELGFTDPEQLEGTRKVLTAAALTYVAAAATSIAYIATIWATTRGRRL